MENVHDQLHFDRFFLSIQQQQQQFIKVFPYLYMALPI